MIYEDEKSDFSLKPNIYFTKNVNDLKLLEVENAVQKVPYYYITKDFQIEKLQYRRRKINNYCISYYYVDEQNRIQGELYGYYSNGILGINSNYVDNKLHGKLTMYFPNGQKHSVTNYVNGNIDGHIYFYSINGNLLIYEHFKNSKLEGISKRYCINGCCVIHLTYENNIIKHIEQYIHNKLIRSFDLTEEEAKKFDSIDRVKHNGSTYYYDIMNNNLLELRCTKLIPLYNVIINNNLVITPFLR
jgi:hypothetical protein